MKIDFEKIAGMVPWKSLRANEAVCYDASGASGRPELGCLGELVWRLLPLLVE